MSLSDRFCINFMLCVVDKFKQHVINLLKAGNYDELKKVKMRILELTLNPREISVENVCKSLDRINELYYKPLIEGLSRLGYYVLDAEVKLSESSKLIIGASSGAFSSVFEVGLSWDYIFDLPYIPSSSIKGLIRNWLIHRVINVKGSLKDRRECVEAVLSFTGLSLEPFHRDEIMWVREKFGSEVDPRRSIASTGLIFIADSYPVRRGKGRTGCGILDFDVVTPHYYEAGTPVIDEFEAMPTPVPHMVIAPGTVFRIIVATSSIDKNLMNKISSCIGFRATNECSLLSHILLSALSSGVGARTSKGYGVFELKAARVRCHTLRTDRRIKTGRLAWR